MSKHEREELDMYIIPPNFVEGGKIFGGMFRLRNAIEAGAIGGGCALLVFRLPVSLTAKIIILCVTALPLAIFGLIGIEGNSLTEFVMNVAKFVRNRRTLCRSDIENYDGVSRMRLKIKKMKVLDCTLGKAMDYQRRQKVRKYQKRREQTKQGNHSKNPLDTESYLPIDKIENGVVFTKDGRYIKIH